jgi:hypothetical protein
MGQSGLTQALTVSATGIVVLTINTFILGQVVDLFSYYASTWELHSTAMRFSMDQIMVFARWFYYIIYILGVVFCAYPIIFVIKRHRYMDVEPVMDQQIYQQ